MCLWFKCEIKKNFALVIGKIGKNWEISLFAKTKKFAIFVQILGKKGKKSSKIFYSSVTENGFLQSF